jgi:hypothetical protein
MIAALYTRRQLTALGIALLGVALLVAHGHAAERPTETRVDLFDTRAPIAPAPRS